MLIFLEGSGGGQGGGKGGWHLVMSLWLSEQSGRADPGETLLNLLGLLLHLPVNEHCCWRYPCVPCHEASRQHLHLTLWPQRKMAAAVTDVSAVLGREPWESRTVRGPGYIGGKQLPQHVSAPVYIQHAPESKDSALFLWNKTKMTSSPPTTQSIFKVCVWWCADSRCVIQREELVVSQDGWPGWSHYVTAWQRHLITNERVSSPQSTSA